jgi:predicted naringenin-chalcone synthase
MSAVLTGAGFAVPAAMDQAGLWHDFFRSHYAGDRMAERIFASSAITTRHGVADPRLVDVSSWTTGQRMSRYVEEAPRLAKAAIAPALAAADLDPIDIGLFTVASCTGYSTPGLDLMLARDMGMDPSVQRLLVGHMGCYAALPALGAVADFVSARRRPAVLLCIELTSLHIQPATDEPAQMVAHALFSDAAAAVVMMPDDAPAWPAPDGGLTFVDIVALADHSTADHMTWDITDLGFRMGLSPQVPNVLSRHVADVVENRLLAPHGLRPEDVTGWAVHPGGRRILEVVEEKLRLPAAVMGPSYAVLDSYGNCSSATVLMVLQQLPAEPGPVVAMAFGPGLTLYAALFQRS